MPTHDRFAEEAPNYQDLASGLVAERHSEMTDAVMPADVVEAYATVLEGVSLINGASAQIASDLDELNANKIMLPPAGYTHKKSQVKQAASTQVAEGRKLATAGIARLRETLAKAALPELDPRRESLARETFNEAIGGATGPALAQRLSALADRGALEAVAVAFTDHGRTICDSRGLRGRDLDSALETSKAIAVAKAVERGQTEKARKAALAYKNVGRLQGAIDAAGMGFEMTAKQRGAV